MKKIEKILFTIITSIIFLGIVALGIIEIVNEDTSLTEKIISISIISILGCGFDIISNLFWWGLIQ